MRFGDGILVWSGKVAVLLVGFDGQSWSGEFSKREQRESTNGVFFWGF